MNEEECAIAKIETAYAKYDAMPVENKPLFVQRKLSNRELGLMDDIEFFLRNSAIPELTYATLRESLKQLSKISLELQEYLNAKID